MKTQPWQDLRDELDRWAEAGRTATLWWRDDDAVMPGPLLDRLAERLSEGKHLGRFGHLNLLVRQPANVTCKIGRFRTRKTRGHRPIIPAGQIRGIVRAHGP